MLFATFAITGSDPVFMWQISQLIRKFHPLSHIYIAEQFLFIFPEVKKSTNSAARKQQAVISKPSVLSSRSPSNANDTSNFLCSVSLSFREKVLSRSFSTREAEPVNAVQMGKKKKANRGIVICTMNSSGNRVGQRATRAPKVPKRE
jgi:hypothetical protein